MINRVLCLLNLMFCFLIATSSNIPSVEAAAATATQPEGGFIQFEAGKFLLKNDGTVWLLSNHTIQPIEGMTDVKKISGAPSHVLALKNDGTIVSYGSNDYGELGDQFVDEGAKDYSASVVGLTNVIDIATYQGSSYALTRDGALWVWGNRAFQSQGYLQLAVEIPVRVPQTSNIVSLASGDEVVMLNKDQTVSMYRGTEYSSIFKGTQTYGDQTYTSLFDYQSSIYHVPAYFASVDKVAKLDHVRRIWGTSRGEAKFAMKSDGTVWVWGDGMFDGVKRKNRIPQLIKEMKYPVKIAGGIEHALFLMPDGTLRGSGSNFYGERGDGKLKTVNSEDRQEAWFHPKKINGIKDVIDIWAGQYESYALTKDGKLWFWGINMNINKTIPNAGYKVTVPTLIPYKVIPEPLHTTKPY